MRYRSRAVKAAIGAAVPTLAIALGTGIPATANASSDGQQARTLKGLTCMPKPSACGFPDATNTGVPPGTPLTVVNGTVTLSTDGQVFSNRDVRGSIVVTGDNVTIEKVRVTGRSEVPLIYTKGGSAVIRDVEVNLSGEEAGKGIAFDNYTAQRVWFHNGLDCAHQGRNVTITDSYCDLPKLSQGSSAHADGFQSDGGGNYTFRHNTIRNPNEQTSAILMSTNTSPISNVVIDHNLMSGGAPMTSGNPLDVYIQGTGWLRVGLGDGRAVPSDFQYTRAGNLTVNAAGQLTTQDGHYLVGLGATATPDGSGGFTYAPNATDSYITIPPGSTDVTIGQDGGVSYVDQDARSATFGQRVVAGYLALGKFSNEGGLQRSGGSLWLPSASSGPVTIGTPNTNGFGQTNAGMLEMSNVDLATQFTTMITAQRGFQANSRVISTADEMLQDLVNLKR